MVTIYYDYYNEVKNDVIDYIKNNIDLSEFDSLVDLQEYLYDELFVEDSVTGNGSGSYTMSNRKAWEYVGDNLDLLGMRWKSSERQDIHYRKELRRVTLQLGVIY